LPVSVISDKDIDWKFLELIEADVKQRMSI